MNSATPPRAPTREERLAAQLRANLQRRKQQARALGQDRPAEGAMQPTGEPASNPALVKPAADG